MGLDIGDEWKDGSASDFGDIFIIFGGPEKVITVTGGIAVLVGAVGACVRMGFVTPIGVI